MKGRRRIGYLGVAGGGTSTGGGGTPVGGDAGILITELSTAFTLRAPAETNAVQGEATATVIRITQTESNAAPTETAASLRMSGAALNEANPAPVETNTAATRYFAVTTADNDASQTTPANANGGPNGTFCVVKTNNAVADLTNPVIVTSSGYAVPATGTFTAKRIRMFFSIPARATATDTITFAYNIGGGDVVFFTHAGTAAVSFLTEPQLFDVSALTLAQLAAIQIKVSYLSSVVATPNTQVNWDASAIELVRTP